MGQTFIHLPHSIQTSSLMTGYIVPYVFFVILIHDLGQTYAQAPHAVHLSNEANSIIFIFQLKFYVLFKAGLNFINEHILFSTIKA